MAQKFLLSSRIFIPISWRKQRNSYFKIKIWFKMLRLENAVITNNEFCRWTFEEKDENVFKDFWNLKRCCRCSRTTQWVNKKMPRTANLKQKSTFSHWLDLLFCLQYVIEYDNFLFFYFDSQWVCVRTSTFLSFELRKLSKSNSIFTFLCKISTRSFIRIFVHIRWKWRSFTR